MKSLMEMREKTPAQYQNGQPGIEAQMEGGPLYDAAELGANRLKAKVTFITSGHRGRGSHSICQRMWCFFTFQGLIMTGQVIHSNGVQS